METFTVLVADPYRTAGSQAVLGSLRRWSRRDGRNMRVVLDPNSLADSPFDPTRISDGIVLLLQAQQAQAANNLLKLWEQAAAIAPGKKPAVLPILVTPDSRACPTLSSATSRFLPQVTVPEEDISVEHGGLITLSDDADYAIGGALDGLFLSSGAIEHSPCILQVCSCLQGNTFNTT